jgi:adenylosuccinate synthase
MKKISVIIGANWGDEGKGVMTDYLCNAHTLNVRFNGGAQAGHTVVTPTGVRHVFHHFGSGTLRGAKTFLSSHFITNPILFAKELKGLHNSGIYPTIFIDEKSLVTIPFDMMINQAIEVKRGDKRHGSCGVGICETIDREFSRIEVGHIKLLSDAYLTSLLRNTRDNWVPHRLKSLGLTKEDIPYLMSETIIERFIEDFRYLKHNSMITTWEEIYAKHWFNDFVFEGAQGLQLDQDNKQFPHVTRSKTGITNVINMLSSVRYIKEIDVFYMSRVYATRHGAGPLKNELKKLPYGKVIDETNQPNPHQGTLRFAPLEVHDLIEEITKDIKNKQEFTINPNICFTCIDQLGKSKMMDYCKELYTGKAYYSEIAESVAFNIRAKQYYSSYGPTRDTIIKTELK